MACDWGFGQAASFCQARRFLCDWMCKREAVIQQRSHATSRHSEHVVFLLRYPVSSASTLDYVLGFHLLLWCCCCSDVIRFFCCICCHRNEKLLHLNKWEMWADLCNTAGWDSCCFMFTPRLYSAFIFSFSPRMCIHLQAVIARIIYRRNCWNANPTSPLCWEIILTSLTCYSFLTSLPVLHLCLQWLPLCRSLYKHDCWGLILTLA